MPLHVSSTMSQTLFSTLLAFSDWKVENSKTRPGNRPSRKLQISRSCDLWCNIPTRGRKHEDASTTSNKMRKEIFTYWTSRRMLMSIQTKPDLEYHRNKFHKKNEKKLLYRSIIKESLIRQSWARNTTAQPHAQNHDKEKKLFSTFVSLSNDAFH